MTVAVSNTNLTDSFNSWRLNTNLAATVISNNAVTVFRAGSSARGKAVTGNTHVKGTVSAVELRTDTIRGGNAAMGTAGKSGAIIIASNTSVTGTTLTVSSDTTFTGNVDFETAGVDRVNLGSIDRVIVSGGTVGQFLRVAGTAGLGAGAASDNPQFKSLTLRDITDLSSNSAHIVLSGANSTFSVGGDSPHLILAGRGNSGADRFHVYAGTDSVAGDDDLIIQLTDNVGDSNLNINNAANTNMATISSRGSISANGITLSGTGTFNGDVTLGNATADTITMKGNFANQHTEGTATFTKLGVQTATVATGVDLEVARSMKIGKNIQVVGNSVFDTNVTVSGTLLVPGGISGVGATAAYEVLNITGNTVLGNASTDDIQFLGTVSTQLTTTADISLTAPAKIKLSTGNTIIGANGKLHANNAITNSTIKGVMLENSGVTAATYGSASAFPVVTVDAQGLVTTVTTSALNNATASVKGIASFSADNFLVSSGVVTVKNNGIILGTETTGDYIATIAGTANEITVSGSGSETAGVTLSLPDDVTIGQDLTVSRHLIMGDSDIIKLGDSSDLLIYHNGTNSYILDQGVGNLILGGTNLQLTNAGNSAAFINCYNGDRVDIHYNNVIKLATTNTGVTVTGTAVATGLDINGAADISGTLTVGNVTVTGTLAGAIEADTIIPAASADTSAYIAFFNTATGAQAIKTDTGLTYNASTNALTTTTFVGALSGNATTATTTPRLQTARNIGGVSFNGTASINLPGVNTSGNQNTSGNATTATNLTAGAKTISGALTVGAGTSSDIYMTDTDETTRRIHCNSNNVGFLNAAGGWSAYSTNAGLWHCTAGLSVTGNMSASGVVSGSQFNGAWQYLPAGTVALFHQTTAPTGWTKRTDHNNKAFRVVSGSVTTGGTQPFTTAFANKGVSGSVSSTTVTGSVSGNVANHTLTTAQIPAHTHTYTRAFQNSSGGAGGVKGGGTILGIGYNNQTTGSTGSNGVHSHGWSGTIATNAHNHTFSGTAINMAVQYVDIIMATKA